MRTSPTLTALLAFALTSFARAQTAVPAAEPSRAEPPKADARASTAPVNPGATVTIQGTGPSSPVVSRAKDILSVDFPDEEIRTILHNVADLFELNLVVPDSLQGKTSVKLRDVTWHQIFQVVLSPIGYTFVEDGNIIKIVSQDSLQQEPPTTEIFILNYARAADIQPSINALVESGKGGKIVIDTRSNALVITERPSVLNRIRTILQQLDQATDQVMIESKFIEVTDSDVKNLGVNWASLNNYQLGVGGINQTWKHSSDQTSINGPNTTTGTTTYNNINGTTTSTTQINTGNQLLQVTTTDPTTGATTTSYQVQPIASTGTTTAITAPSVTDTNVLNTLASLTNNAATNRVASAVFSASDFNVILSALQTLSNTKVISNPTVVTLNNTEAIINVGEEDPIPNYAYNEQKGTFEVSGFTYKPIGILLKVTPQVNARGFIKLTLAPEVSQKLGTTTFGGASGAAIPIIGTRKASTQVSLKDGYTMGVGGLLTSNATNGTTKVPLLGDIPILGNLFKSKSRNASTTNLLIFITAKTVSAEGAPIEQVFDPRQIRQMEIKREDLPGYREKSDPFGPAPVPADSRKKSPATPAVPNQNPMRQFSRS